VETKAAALPPFLECTVLLLRADGHGRHVFHIDIE
jgi:hypothetical protein